MQGLHVNANPEESQARGASDDLGTAEKSHAVCCTPNVLSGVVAVICFKISEN